MLPTISGEIMLLCIQPKHTDSFRRELPDTCLLLLHEERDTAATAETYAPKPKAKQKKKERFTSDGQNTMLHLHEITSLTK